MPVASPALALIALFRCAAAAGPGSADWEDSPYVREWLVCGPFAAEAPATDKELHAAFEKDWLVDHGGEDHILPHTGLTMTGTGKGLTWTWVTTTSDMNLLAAIGKHQNVVGYAWADLNVAAEGPAWLAIGSDDGVKAWLDGKVVHVNETYRKFKFDEDLVPVQMARGRHTVLLKISQGGGNWQCSLRCLDATQALRTAAANGNTALVESLIHAGTPVDAPYRDGWTPLHCAADTGQLETARCLVRLGANKNAVAVDGATPLEMARRSGRAAVASFLAGAGAIEAPVPFEAARRVDLLVSDLARGFRPGVEVGVVREGTLVYGKGFGYANLDPVTRMTPHTKIYLASLSKQFTAMAIMMLAERGALSYDDSIRKYVPEFPPSGEGITVRHLLHHISGLPRDLYPGRILNGVPAHDRLLFTLDQFKGETYKPGTQSSYSNFGYHLLGLAVARASGTSYERFVTDHIFRPLGMTETVVHHPGGPPVTGRAVGYRDTGRDYTVADFENSAYDHGPEGILSSVADLAKWSTALDGERLVKRTTLEEAFAPVKLAEGDDDQYGFGWMVHEVRGLRCVSHSGFHWGVNTAMLHFPNERFSVIVLSNDGDFQSYRTAQRIAEVYLFNRMKPNPTE